MTYMGAEIPNLPPKSTPIQSVYCQDNKNCWQSVGTKQIN